MSGVDPIELERTISCSRLHAFEIFSARTDNWWPRELSRSGSTHFTVGLEAWAGGRVYEYTAEGEQLEWGELTAWQQPRRIGLRWHLHGPREQATNVEVSFSGEEGSTTVRLVESGFASAGADREQLRERSLSEWELALDRFAAACVVEPSQSSKGEG